MAEKLRQASARGSYKEVVRLLDDGTAFEADENGRTALHLASSAGHADVVGILLSSGCAVNARDLAGCTALQRAAADGHLEVVRQLIKYGADVNYQDNVHGNTALHEASWKGYSRTVAALGRARANLHLKNRGGFAALHLCCQNGHNQSCRELLLAGCDPDLQNNYGDTPLHTSARYGHAGVTRILISAECHVSDQNKNGDTALHIAAAMGRRKLTRILLEAGCDKNLCNKQNETARDIAIRKDLKEIIQILDSPPPLPQTKLRESSRRKPNDKKREKNGSGTSSKDSGSRHKDKKKQKHAHKVQFEKSSGKQWSPYGCHYYPDPKQFPSPNLDTLPHEPLMKGEQYYLDLAGNIRKGPIGVGYTCYCAPFFRHMEARLDRDKQELKDHIDLAHEKLDQKVANLEQKTQDQIQELSQTVSQEKNRCEERHLYLTKWLQGELGGHPEDRAPLPIQRTRSLELLLDEGPREHWRAHGDANSADELDDHVKWDGRRVRRIAWKEHGHPEGLEQNTWRSHRHHNYNAQEPYPLEPYNQEETGTVVESWQGQRLKEMDDRSSDSSEGEEDQVTMYSRVHNVDYGFTRQPSLNKSYCAIPNKNPDYENIVSYKNGQYKVQESHNLPNYPLHSHISEYPGEEYRALDLDPHNDSGYSTKIYGSSKGPSPALSGQADCINGLPQTAYTSQLPSLYERAYPSGERQTSHNIGAASLV